MDKNPLGTTPDIHARRKELLFYLSRTKEPVRPIDLGGRDGSSHSGDLLALCKQGMVEKFAQFTWGNRGSNKYQITAQGRAYLESEASTSN